MRTSAALFTLGSISAVSAAVDISTIKRVSSAPVVPGAYIVELDAPNALGRRSVVSAHTLLYRALDKNGANWDLITEYDADGIFTGAAVTVNSDEDLKALAQVPHVKSIKPVYLHPRPEPAYFYQPTGKSDPKVPVDTFSTHVMTGVDKLHAEGYSGKGIKVGIIDTGIDYLHPSLGLGFGPGFKVAQGYDFVGDAYTGANTPVPDNDPMDCGGHGTHVAGIVGANLDATYNFTGAAPGATLGAYRVFGCDGSVADSILIEALLRAHKDGNYVISLSIGGAAGWTSAASAVVASRIADAGKIVSIAAGNDGAYGSWYTSSPGNGADVISVASVENTQLIAQSIVLSDGHAPIAYGGLTPLPITTTLPIYALSTDTSITDDGCNPLPASTPDLSPYVTIVRRGTCTFIQKLDNIAAKGGKYMLIYDNKDEAFSSISTGNYVAALITQADGKYLVGEFAKKSNLTLTFPQTGGSVAIPSSSGGLMSTFSTYGPSYDMFFKPNVAGPGGNILSTYPRAKGSYAILSGTSMATPFISGSSALLLEALGKAKSVYTGARTRFQTTAAGVPSSFTDGDPYQTLAQQGAGLINAYKAVHATTYVSPGQLQLNDTTHSALTHAITVKNTGKKAQTYKISHVSAGTATTLASGQAVPFPVPLSKAAATVTFSQKSITVLPGLSGILIASIHPPTGLDAKTFPVYSGWIKITGDVDDMQVSYLGVAAAMKDMQVIDTSSTYFNIPLPTVVDSTGNVQNGSVDYSFQGSDYPTIVYRLNAGTPALHIDLVTADTKIDSHHKRGASVAKRDLLGWFWDWLFGKDQSSSFAKFPTLGPIGESEFIPRNSNADAANNGYNTVAFSPAAYANGTAVAPGSYRFLIRALKITGDSHNNDDYEKWLSPVINVVGKTSAPASNTTSTTSAAATTTSAH